MFEMWVWFTKKHMPLLQWELVGFKSFQDFQLSAVAIDYYIITSWYYWLHAHTTIISTGFK